MRRDKVGKIVRIGNGLCRVIVRSERLAGRLGRIPGVEVRAEDAEHLGWWIIFPDALRPVIEPAFGKESRTIVTRQAEQLSLLDALPPDEGETAEEEPDRASVHDTEGTEHGPHTPR